MGLKKLKKWGQNALLLLMLSERFKERGMHSYLNNIFYLCSNLKKTKASQSIINYNTSAFVIKEIIYLRGIFLINYQMLV